MSGKPQMQSVRVCIMSEGDSAVLLMASTTLKTDGSASCSLMCLNSGAVAAVKSLLAAKSWPAASKSSVSVWLERYH